jgi:hypothetical protein
MWHLQYLGSTRPKYPKEMLYEFYQTRNGIPLFWREPVDQQDGGGPLFRCTVTCPAVTVNNRSFPDSVFVADGPTKKLAELAASKKALLALLEAGLLAPRACLPLGLHC